MISFADFLRNIGKLTESKQVGTIYHFCKMNTIVDLINLDKQKKYGADEILTLFSLNGKISTTRNYNLSRSFGDSYVHTRNGYNARIALDGNAISEKYKVKPVLGLNNTDPDIFNLGKNDQRMSRHDREDEEAVMSDNLPLSKYIIRIDFLAVSQEARSYYDSVIKPKLDAIGIKSDIRKVWTPVKLEETYETEYIGFEIIL